ncbi:MAG: hypothetical protein ACW98D_19965 [Promethearchaeota archaeon]
MTVILIFFVISLVYAAHTATTPNGDTETSFSLDESVDGLFNITINNTNAGQAANITQINMTFSSSNFIVNGTNGTNTLYSSVVNTSKQFSWINSTAYLINGSVNNSYFWFYAKANAPGVYNLTVTYLNGTTAAPVITSTNFTVTINDTTSPNITISYPSNRTNHSLSYINFNLTVLDYKLAPNGICWYTLDSGVTNTSMFNTTAVNDYNATNTSIADGNYVAKFWCNDTANNVNNSEITNFTIDTVDPTITHLCSPTTISEGGTITCSCSATDDRTGIASSSYTTNPVATAIGTYTTGCTATDHAGNSATNTITYYVIQGGGGGGSSGSSSGSYDNTYVEDNKELSEIGVITKSLSKKSRIRIKINNEKHHVGVKELTTTTATIEITSTPQEKVFNIGTEEKFDVTVDGYYDLSVKLNSIESGKAEISLRSIHEKIPEDLVDETETPTTETTAELKESSNRSWMIGLAAVIIVIILGIIFLKKKK